MNDRFLHFKSLPHIKLELVIFSSFIFKVFFIIYKIIHLI